MTAVTSVARLTGVARDAGGQWLYAQRPGIACDTRDTRNACDTCDAAYRLAYLSLDSGLEVRMFTASLDNGSLADADRPSPMKEVPVITPRVPLRTVDPALLAALHSEGLTYGTYERKPARDLILAKDPADMDLSELIATQRREPLSESRRAYLEVGAGVASLDQPDPHGRAYTDLGDNHNALRYGTPYEVLDPITAKQIEWEKAAALSGPITTARLIGGRVKANRFMDRPTFERVRKALTTMQPHPRVRLTKEAFAEAAKRSRANVSDHIYRHLHWTPAEWHNAQTLTHEGEIVGYVQHGSKPLTRTADGTPWIDRFGNARDMTEIELGTHLMADEELEELLGDEDMTMDLPLIDLKCVCACECGNVLPSKDAYIGSFGICDECDYCGPRHGCDHPEHPYYCANWPDEQPLPLAAPQDDTRADLGYGEDEDIGDSSDSVEEAPMHTRVTSIKLAIKHAYRLGLPFGDTFGSLLHRPAGQNMVYIGMPGKSAQRAGIAPEDIGPFGKPWECLNDPRGWETAYREYLWHRIKTDADFALAVRDLHGKTLVCYCKGKNGGDDRCHGDSLAAAAEWLFHGIEGSAIEH